MARTNITQDLIIEMNELYLKIKTYAGVSRALGGSPTPATIKKYIVPNYISKEKRQIKKFSIDSIKELDIEKFKGVKNWGDLCILSPEEREEIEVFWEELLI
jgi:hypothetical protein